MNIDFNLHCLPNLDYNYDDYQGAQHILNHLKACYIKSAVLTPFYNPSRESVSSFLSRRKAALSKLSCNHIELMPAAVVPLIDRISTTKGLNKLTVNKTEFIYLSLPLKFDPMVYDTEIHKLMYQENLIPIFSDFDIAISLYEDNELYKILNTPYVAFQVNISSLSNDIVFKTVKNLILQGRCVLFGTGIKDYSNRIPNYNIPIKKFEKILGQTQFNYYMLKCERIMR